MSFQIWNLASLIAWIKCFKNFNFTKEEHSSILTSSNFKSKIKRPRVEVQNKKTHQTTHAVQPKRSPPRCDVNVWCQGSDKSTLPFVFLQRHDRVSRPVDVETQVLNVIGQNTHRPTYESPRHVREVFVVRSRLTTGWYSVYTHTHTHTHTQTHTLKAFSIEVGIHHNNSGTEAGRPRSPTHTHTHTLKHPHDEPPWRVFWQWGLGCTGRENVGVKRWTRCYYGLTIPHTHTHT